MRLISFAKTEIMTSLIVDASIAAKWVVDQPLSTEARALMGREELFLAPTLLLAEAGNALWRHFRVGDITREQTERGLNVIGRAFTQLVPLDQLHNEALRLAIDLDHPIYECFYLALAQREKAPLVTADKRLLKLGERLADIEVRAL